MMALLSGTLLLLGTFFILLSAIGILKMPDLYTRMSATTKASTLGIGLVLMGTTLYWQDFGIASRAIAIILFLFLTAPVAAHIIGRAAYFGGEPLWDETRIDELKGKRNRE
ncbi:MULTISPECIES: monovalent cation/H(+) antiporter subunit G [Prosthecochloris]|uniref:Monovalent cation/H(+) antiporter subunit G n=1 Tax=Prosthecochloris vibrioformis TaxID=1098 RepID=A0A5C4RT72_PROVB|nr:MULTISPECIES: monovalent cation/H(+) antiporter subunit G [Prosthecochloris]ANT64655.1 Multiple resistance and pH homeostasis protein G [Prosthecochloris sp. CIB 2401]TNJ34192.1 monovalent cation/H(+) antiporter subunit G [Prosthecochloris vibrioformis]